MPTVHRRKVTLVLIWIAIISAVLVVPVAACEILCGYGPEDSRLNDAAGMVERRELIGLSDAELEEKIGHQPYPRTVGGMRAYFLRKDDSCIDSIWLGISFAEDGTVVDARIVSD